MNAKSAMWSQVMQSSKPRQRKASTISEWLYILLLLLVCGVILFLPARARSHDDNHLRGHTQYHAEFYSKWTQENGGSCCNNADCAPLDDARFRVRGEQVEVLIESEWVQVPREKIRPFVAPDMNSHLCHIGTTIYCFVFGGGT